MADTAPNNSGYRQIQKGNTRYRGWYTGLGKGSSENYLGGEPCYLP